MANRRSDSDPYKIVCTREISSRNRTTALPARVPANSARNTRIRWSLPIRRLSLERTAVCMTITKPPCQHSADM